MLPVDCTGETLRPEVTIHRDPENSVYVGVGIWCENGVEVVWKWCGSGENMAETQERDKRIKVIVRNRRASYDYEFLQRFEAGISLIGSEVKSIRAGNIMLVDSYATIEKDGLILKNMHIGTYELASGTPPDPTRPRRLLLHKTELRKIARQTLEKGLTLIPVQVYFKGPLVKIELAVARGRKRYDKRQALMKKDTDREIKRATRQNQ